MHYGVAPPIFLSYGAYFFFSSSQPPIAINKG